MTSRRLVLAGLAVEAGCLAVTLLSFGGGDRRAIPLAAALLLSGAAYLWASFAVRNDGTGRGTGTILGFTLLFWLTLLPGPVLFDDDIHRYLWDGKVTLSGVNPYRHPPSDPALAHLRDEGHRLIGYPRLPTPYPPAAQAIFAAVRAVSGGNITAAKALMGVFFAGTVWLVMVLLARAGCDRRLVILWAWNPVVLKEFANSGHVDQAAVFLLLLAVVLLEGGRDSPGGGKREALAGAALGLAAAIKLFPLFAAPFLLWRGRRRAAIALGAAGALLLAYLPFLGAGRGVAGSLETYLRYWLFNHGPFALWEALWAWAAPGTAERAARVSYWLLAASVALAAGWRLRRSDTASFAAGLGAFLLGLVVLSPAVMPWYLSWGLPFLFSRPLLAAHGFTVLSAVSYLYYLGHRDVPAARLAEYGMLALFLLLDLARNKKNPRRGGAGGLTGTGDAQSSSSR